MLVVDASVWVAAFDPTDTHHLPSVAFLRAVEAEHVPVVVPAFGVVEIACAIARRTGSETAASSATRALMADPDLSVEPMSAELLAAATQVGISRRLRGADALYVATALIVGGRLVAWDREMLERGDALEPTVWQERLAPADQAGSTSTTAL